MAKTACELKRKSDLKSWATSRTSRINGALRKSSSVLFWYFRISRRATVPGLNLCGCHHAARPRYAEISYTNYSGSGGGSRSITFLTPPLDDADLRAAFEALAFFGAAPPVPAACGSVRSRRCIGCRETHSSLQSASSVPSARLNLITETALPFYRRSRTVTCGSPAADGDMRQPAACGSSLQLRVSVLQPAAANGTTL